MTLSAIIVLLNEKCWQLLCHWKNGDNIWLVASLIFSRIMPVCNTSRAKRSCLEGRNVGLNLLDNSNLKLSMLQAN